MYAFDTGCVRIRTQISDFVNHFLRRSDYLQVKNSISIKDWFYFSFRIF